VTLADGACHHVRNFSPNFFTQRHAQEIAQRQAVSLLKRYHGKSPKKGYCHEESKLALASVGAKGAEKEKIFPSSFASPRLCVRNSWNIFPKCKIAGILYFYLPKNPEK
jgi:hypothetical protein